MKSFRVLSGLFVAFSFVVAAQTAMAQSTIFNIPSGDTVDKGKAYAEFDFLPQAPGPDAGSRTFLYNPRLVVGGPHDTEFGVNFPTYHTGGGNSFCSSANCYGDLRVRGAEFKWKFYKNDDQGLSFVTGALLHQPLNGRNERCRHPTERDLGVVLRELYQEGKNGRLRSTLFRRSLCCCRYRERPILRPLALIAEERSLDMSSLSPRKSVSLPTGTAARIITGISPLEFRSRCPVVACSTPATASETTAGPTRMPRKTVTSSCITA